ncbi:MAG: LysM peptidoglycan-binding domain-containing protein [Chloroflexota bacterium]|nr:LysM peptidoglycan-binding domain-containing protein [Chloroflexota bacterium]MDE2918902.1 LysM peptidoglycan-binding domain-containing protein [Chloroflexota bacterium]
MRSLRQYRLFVTLLVLPVLAIVLIVILVMALTGGDEEPTAEATPTATPAVSGGLPSTPSAIGVTPVAPPITVAPTQPPVPEPTPPPATPTPTEPPAPTPTPTPEGPIEYAVQEGDTLFSIASAYGVSVADVVDFNDLPDENFIFVGQVLEIPTDPAQVIERRESRPVATTAVVVPSDGLNVRGAPSTETGEIQYVAPGGSELALTGVIEVIDGIEWREVDDGNWVQSQYLEIGVRAAPTAAPAATAAPQTTPAPAATPAPAGETVRATVVPTAGLNVRVSADPNASVAYVAPGASEVELTGETQIVNGVTWWRLTDGNWVQGQFLKFG